MRLWWEPWKRALAAPSGWALNPGTSASFEISANRLERQAAGLREEFSEREQKLTRAKQLVLGARETEMQLAASVLELPHLHADSTLLAVVSRWADAMLESLPARGDVVARAASAVARCMATELPTLSGTAAAMSMPERTLQRRLAEAGATHSALVDDMRRHLALKHLAHAGLSIAEIAFLLHFADSTAFDRAFKRWTGDTPAQYRSRLF